jgi:hypothetical protein
LFYSLNHTSVFSTEAISDFGLLASRTYVPL